MLSKQTGHKMNLKLGKTKNKTKWGWFMVPFMTWFGDPVLVKQNKVLNVSLLALHFAPE